MARARAAEPSDSENEAVSSPKAKSTNGSKQSMAPDQVEDVADGSAEGSGDEESEYEIESIIDAKRGGYGPGFAYLVSWKGYSADHNSWVEDKDAGNAGDLIAEYWKKNSKDKKGRKSIDKPKGGRKSVARDASAEVSTSAAKKRGRKKGDTDGEGESEEGEPKVKRAKKSTGETKAAKKSSATTSMDVDEINVDEIGTMEKYMELESWEKLIKTVDTVEKGDDNQLYVYFTLKTDDERQRQRSDICKQRFPLHLINFYEGHLRWKQIDETDTDA